MSEELQPGLRHLLHWPRRCRWVVDAPAPVVLQEHQDPSSEPVMQHQTFKLTQSSSKAFAKYCQVC